MYESLTIFTSVYRLRSSKVIVMLAHARVAVDLYTQLIDELMAVLNWWVAGLLCLLPHYQLYIKHGKYYSIKHGTVRLRILF